MTAEFVTPNRNMQRKWLMQRFNRDGQRQVYMPLQERVVRDLELHRDLTEYTQHQGHVPSHAHKTTYNRYSELQLT